MQKKPFSQPGFELLQTELYALDDVLLQLEADAIAINFKAWMNQHFELSVKQLTFLNLIDQKAVYFLEMQTSFAVANRLPITLQKTEDDDEKTGKVIKPKSKFTVTADSAGKLSVEGDLEIQIYYLS